MIHRYTLRMLALIFCGAIVSGCVYMRSPFIPPIGTALTDLGVPVDTTFDSTNLGDRVGRSTSHCMFGLFAWGDATVHSAARQGGIQVVEHVDGKITIVLLGLYSSYEIVVSGR